MSSQQARYSIRGLCSDWEQPSCPLTRLWRVPWRGSHTAFLSSLPGAPHAELLCRQRRLRGQLKAPVESPKQLAERTTSGSAVSRGLARPPLDVAQRGSGRLSRMGPASETYAVPWRGRVAPHLLQPLPGLCHRRDAEDGNCPSGRPAPSPVPVVFTGCRSLFGLWY